MKRIITLLALLVAGCAPAISDQTHKDLHQAAWDVKQLQLRQAATPEKTTPPDVVLSMVDEARMRNVEIGRICADISKVPSYLYLTCMHYERPGIPTIAQMELTAAYRYAIAGEKERAKGMYRQVILQHPGAHWQSLRQAAEFGLEDLKD